MNKQAIKIKKRTLRIFLVFAVAIVIFLGYFLFNNSSFSVKSGSQSIAGETLEAKFARLSSANTNFCAGPDILDLTDSERLQGSCCSAMDFHRYKEQIEGLKKYSNIKQIPEDPYDISKKLADELLDYQKNIQLSPEEQLIYDEAVNLSHEGGPCCCKCWRWYAFEGLAKYLITEYNFNEEQIAEIWDLEDGCGGSGHIEGMEGH